MAKGRELKGRIKSVEGTRKITSTMEMVAASKLKRAQDRVIAARPYAKALAEVIADLYTPALAEDFPLLRQPAVVRRAAVLLLTSNRGLAGGFNANLIRVALTVLRGAKAEGVETELHLVGRKGIGYFRFIGATVASARTDIGDRPTAAQAEELVTPIVEAFIGERLDALYVVYAKYNSAISTPPVSAQVLPVKPPARTGTARDYLLFPDARAILAALLPAYVRNSIYRALVETACGEQGARRTAMKNATDNAGDILDGLRRTYNRARQAQITQEIAEIVGGAEALRG
jgi:F-type H+-transporting ATPase subunit gamma